MTREEAIRKHRALWNGIAEELENQSEHERLEWCDATVVKAKAMEKLFPEDVGAGILNYCYLCHYANEQRELLDPASSALRCIYCPMVHKENAGKCLDGLWTKFVLAIIDPERRKEAIDLAKQIAALEEVNQNE